MPKHKNWYWMAALIAAWFFDFLFWKKPTGISFLVWAVVLLAAGYMLAWREKKKPAVLSYVVTLIIIASASVLFWREEPATRAVSVLITLAGMVLLTATFLNGYWPFYRIRDHIVESAKAIWGGLSGAVRLGTQGSTPPTLDVPVKPSTWKRIMPVIRGLLIALPIVAVLGVLLSSADPVFADWMKKVLDLEKLPEYLFRLFYILVFAFVLVGIYLHATYPASEAKKPNTNTDWIKPFLGWTETGIVLGAVDLLFLVFVIIQVRYLFGGQSNITETGYTYSEYARHGFGELVAVAMISLLLYLGLSAISKRESRRSQIAFSVLAVALMGLVLVILASSLQRLLLYENAYGFSRLRTYTNIFIYWLAGLLLVAMVLEILRRRGHFALAAVLCIVGFGVTMASINIDGFIVNRNVERTIAGEEFDHWYLFSLSADTVPAVVARFEESSTPPVVRDALGTALACRTKTMEDPAKIPWQGFNLSRSTAYQLLKARSADWSAYQPYKDAYDNWVIKYKGEEISCSPYYFD